MAPSVDTIGSNSVQVKFSALIEIDDVYTIREYRIEYMTDAVDWTIYSTIEPVRGENAFNVVVDNLEVGSNYIEIS